MLLREASVLVPISDRGTGTNPPRHRRIGKARSYGWRIPKFRNAHKEEDEEEEAEEEDGTKGNREQLAARVLCIDDQLITCLKLGYSREPKSIDKEVAGLRRRARGKALMIKNQDSQMTQNDSEAPVRQNYWMTIVHLCAVAPPHRPWGWIKNRAEMGLLTLMTMNMSLYSSSQLVNKYACSCTLTLMWYLKMSWVTTVTTCTLMWYFKMSWVPKKRINEQYSSQILVENCTGM